MNQKLIMKSLSQMKITRKSVSHLPAQHQILTTQIIKDSQNIDPNYDFLSKPNLIKLLEQATLQCNQFKRKYQSIYLQSDQQKVSIMQLNDQINNMTFQIQSITQEKEQMQRYSELLKQKYQTQIQTLELKLCSSQPSTQKDEQIMRLKQQFSIMDSMYKNKLEHLIGQFQEYKNSKNNRQDCRRLLDLQIVKQQHLKQKLQIVTEEYIQKQEQIDNLTEKYQKLLKEYETSQMTNDLLHTDLQQYKKAIDKSRKLGEIQKMNEVLQSSYQKKISVLQSSFKQYQSRLEKQKGYTKRYRQQRNTYKQKNEQLEDKIKITEQKYIQVSVALNSLRKQYNTMEYEMKYKQRDNFETHNTLKCFLTQRSAKDSKYYSSKGKLLVLCKQIKDMKEKMMQLKQQVKYTMQVRKQQIKRYSKQCQHMILFNMEIKQVRIRRLVEQNNIINSTYRAVTDRQSNYKTILRQQDVSGIKRQMERLSKQVQTLQENDYQKKQTIKNLKQQLKSKQKRQRKSRSVFQPQNQQKYNTTHKLLSDIYEDIADQKKKISSTRQNLKQFK